jgi:hypothetical protein
MHVIDKRKLMEIKNLLHNKFNRKRFFLTAGTGITGYFLLKRFPFNIIGKKEDTIRVKINPNSVSRNKAGGKDA